MLLFHYCVERTAEGIKIAVASFTLGIIFLYRGRRQAEDVRLIHLFQEVGGAGVALGGGLFQPLPRLGLVLFHAFAF